MKNHYGFKPSTANTSLSPEEQNNNLTSTTLHLHQTKTAFKETLSNMKSYFPNKTTSNNKNHIVKMIQEQIDDGGSFNKNNIVLD